MQNYGSSYRYAQQPSHNNHEVLLERWITQVRQNIYAGTVPVWIMYFYNEYCVRDLGINYNARKCLDSSEGTWRYTNVDRTLVGLCYWNGTHFNAEIVKLQYDVLNPPNTTQKPVMHAEMKKMVEYHDYTVEELNAIKYSLHNMSKMMNGLGKLNVAQHKHNQRLETKMFNMSLTMNAKLNALYNKLVNNTKFDTPPNSLEQKVKQMDTKLTVLYDKLSNLTILNKKVTRMAKSFNETRARVETYFDIMQSSVDSRINAISQKQWRMEQVLNNINRMMVSLFEAHQNKTHP